MSGGVSLTSLRCIDTPSGAVLHALKKSSEGYAGFAEAYFSEIHEGAVKSWRRHSKMTLNLIVPVGTVRFVVRGQEGFEEFVLGRTPPAQYSRLTVSPGVWLAFQGRGPGTSLIVDITDFEHDPAEAETREIDAFPFTW